MEYLIVTACHSVEPTDDEDVTSCVFSVADVDDEALVDSVLVASSNAADGAVILLEDATRRR